ncbi:MAG: hypothetical protein R2781_10110 [Flavobacteriaceae bacterium]
MTLQTAKQTALIYFILGTLLFFIQWALGYLSGVTLIGIVFLLIALVHNLTVFIILLIQLIKRNELETFFSLLIILLNIPVAIGYGYLLFFF